MNSTLYFQLKRIKRLFIVMMGREGLFKVSYKILDKMVNWLPKRGVIDMTEQEKALRFDELQKWIWWLERRTTIDGKIAKVHVNTFLKGIKEYSEPYNFNSETFDKNN